MDSQTQALIRAAELVLQKLMKHFDGVPVSEWPDLAHAAVLLDDEVKRAKPQPPGPEVA